MPAVEEKLAIFEKLILSDASLTRNAMLDQLRGETERTVKSVKEEIGRDAELAFQKDAQRAALDRDSQIAKADANARILLMKARSEILAGALDELSQKLAGFTQTAPYRGYLMQNIREALERAEIGKAGADGNGGGFCIYLTPRDFELYAEEAAGMARGFAARRGGADMIGGVMVENAGAGIYIDNTLKKKVELCVDELFQASGLAITD